MTGEAGAADDPEVVFPDPPPPETGDDLGDIAIRTFLIADVREYTTFTQERGDEAAARLAERFAQIAREGVTARDGRVVELRGDEALAFSRPLGRPSAPPWSCSPVSRAKRSPIRRSR